MSVNSTNITPIVYGISLTTASILIIGQNPTRSALMFHNRSLTLNIEVAAQPIVAGNAGSMIILPGGFSPLFTGIMRATCAWNGHMVSGSGDVTIFEWP